MKLVGEAVPAKEEAAVPSQTAEDSHGKEKNSCPQMSFNAAELENSLWTTFMF